MTFKRVVEFTTVTVTLVDACAALAAKLVPVETAWAFVDDVGVAKGISLLMWRNAGAVTSASYMVPFVAWEALLAVAGALALVVVPVVSVIEAFLRSTNVCAEDSIESVENTVLGVRSLECAEALTEFCVEVVAFIAFLFGIDNVSATFHVPALTCGSGGGWGVAAALTRRGVEEVRHAVDVGAVKVFVLARAGVGVEFEATGADLVEALAVVSLEAVVEAYWAMAVLRQASANSGVPVVVFGAFLIWTAQA